MNSYIIHSQRKGIRFSEMKAIQPIHDSRMNQLGGKFLFLFILKVLFALFKIMGIYLSQQKCSFSDSSFSLLLLNILNYILSSERKIDSI